MEEELDCLEVPLRGRQVERRAAVKVGDAAVVAEEHVAPQVVQVAGGRRVHHGDDGVALGLVQHPARVLLVAGSPLLGKCSGEEVIISSVITLISHSILENI